MRERVYVLDKNIFNGKHAESDETLKKVRQSIRDRISALMVGY